MAEATLRDVIKFMQMQDRAQAQDNDAQLKATDLVAKEVATLNKMLGRWFMQQAANAGDRLEQEREKRNVRAAIGGQSPSANKTDTSNAILPALQSLTGLIAGVGALAGGIMGLRGWELKALANVENIGKGLRNLIPMSVVKDLRQAFVNQRASILRTFGFSPELKAFGSTDDATLKTPLLTQITNRFKALRSDFMLKYFGIGVDGKATVKVTGPGKALLAIEDGFKGIIDPFRKLGNGITTFLSGTGKATADFLKPFMTGAKSFLSLFGKILAPIGFIISAFDGVNAYLTSDKEKELEKFGEGLGGFLGSFFGAPFDLLKSGVAWITTNWLGVDEDSKFMTALKGFSFEKIISDTVSGIFGMVQDGLDWVILLFSDPTAALNAAWTTALESLKVGGRAVVGLSDILLYPVNATVDWVSKKFGWRDEDLPMFNLREMLTDWIVDFARFMRGILPDISGLATAAVNAISDMMPDWAKTAYREMNAFFDAGETELKKSGFDPSAGVAESPDYMKYLDPNYGKQAPDITPQMLGAGNFPGFNMMDNRTFNSPQTTNSMTLAMESAVDTTIEP